MARVFRLGWALSLGAAGCASAPPLDNPVLIRQAPAEGVCENPILVSPGAPTALSYKEVFERVIDVLGANRFTILAANPYQGVILTVPRIAPGYEQIWKAGNPDPRSRLMATFQSIRQTVVVEIRPGERGGYLVNVVAEKELEDVARPSRVTVGNAVFQELPTVDRQLEVVGPAASVYSGRQWFKIGRDFALEQQILAALRDCH
jgi:hypothetical protein